MKGSGIEKEAGAEDGVSDTESITATAEARPTGDNGLEKSETREDKLDHNSNSNSNTETASTYSCRENLQVPSQVPSRVISRTVSEVRDGIESQRDPDLEQGQENEKNAAAAATNPDPGDPGLVTWSGPDDPENPKNWTISKKWGAVFIVSMFTFVSPVSSSMVAPGLTAIGRDFNISEAFEQNIILSAFVLAYALGPLCWGPLSELYGRVPVLQLSNLGFLAFTLGCGFAQNKGQMIAFRFLSGLGGSAALAIGGGVLGDLFIAEHRGRAMSMYSLAPLLGPAVGPIAGAFITENTTWRWAFWATCIADGIVQCAGLYFLRETYAPVLLDRKRRLLVAETGNPDLRTPYDDLGRKDASIIQTLGTAMTRPFKLLATQIIVQCIAVYAMYLYGLMYLMLASFPTLFTTPKPDGYGMSVGIGGLNYISLGLGFFLGAQICAPLQDRIYVSLKRRYGIGKPEFRVPMMVPGAVLVPVGLVIYGWTAEYKTHWIGPNIGAMIFASGAIIGFQCLQGFLVDSYQRYAASAVGANTVLRSLAGFGFPLFAPYMYDRLGYGWGNTLMALLGVVIGWPGPILLWKYGEILRKRSPFAAGA
ncbi:MFS general substrate transporter [Hypoxylon trugodes]|uniref:MFS general substrate transporter n=1 Tax=Hypoxylon trugodes TaxID=326681 RepID=UPI00219B22BD|nr:MFS general substrate transporter [Hypoxylon trugodes]KAI1384998.1 MFS general substrate transporter [Hypoxylon trugodes]